MRNYILWTKPEEPLINRERYIWFHDNTYFLWDGYTWVDVNSQTGRIDSSALPDNVVYDNDITALNEIPGIKASMPKVFQIYLNLMDANLRPGTPVGGRYNPSTGTLEGDIISEISDGTTTKTNAEAGNNTEVRHWSTRKQWVENAFTWYSIGTFTAGGSIIGTWSDPIPVVIGRDGIDGIDGKDGVDGVDGVNMEFIFTLLTGDEQFQEIATPYSNPDVTDYVPTLENEGSVDVDWFDHPQGISREFQIEAMCYRKKNYSTGKWGVWVGPTKWSIWGETGKDGDGIEYIFRLTTEDEITEDGQLQSRFWPPTTQAQVDAIGEAYQHDDWYPANLGWDDDPKDVTNEKKYQFVAKRKYKGEVGTGGTWLPFSTPTLWDKYVLADVAGFTAFAFTRSSEDLSEDTCTGGDANRYPWPSQTITPQGAIRQVTWHDSVPVNTSKQLWMVQRFFPNDGSESAWTQPVRWGDDANLNIEYSNDYPWGDPMPALPNLNGFIDDRFQPDGVNEELWRDTCQARGLGTWSDDLVNPKYMAVCYRKSGVWEEWTVAQIGAENGVSYIPFTIYKTFDSYTDKPPRPEGGHYDTDSGTLTQVPSGWTLTEPTDENKYNWYSTANFHGETGDIKDRWSLPQRLNYISVKVNSQTRYFQANDIERNVQAPDQSVDPTTVGWATNTNHEAAIISASKPYLWAFDRYVYSDGTKYQSPPAIIRYFNDAVDIEAIAAEVTADIDEELAAVKNRLDKITKLNKARTDITEFEGLYQIMTSYKDSNQKSFADLLIDSESATIKSFAGSEINGIVNSASQTTDGLAGFVQTMVTKVDTEGTISAALRTTKAEAITDAVSKSYDTWKITYYKNGELITAYKAKLKDTAASESWYPYINVDTVTYTASGSKWIINYIANGKSKSEEMPKTKDSVSQESWYPYIQNVTYSSNVERMEELSVIKQTSDAINLAVTGPDGNIGASISILAGATVQGGQIVLSASEIILNGGVIANAINTDGITVAGGKVILNRDGLMATDAKILGTLVTKQGFFGSAKNGSVDATLSEIAADLARTTKQLTYDGIFITNEGIKSSNYTNLNTPAGFMLNGTDFELYGPNGTKIASDTIKIVGEIEATSGKIGSASKYFTIGADSSNAWIKSGMTSLTDTTNNGIYLGTDGIALGGGAFKVTSAGVATVSGAINASSGSITGTLYLGSTGSIETDGVYSNGGIIIKDEYFQSIGDTTRTQLDRVGLTLWEYTDSSKSSTLYTMVVLPKNITRINTTYTTQTPVWTTMNNVTSRLENLSIVSSLPSSPDSATLYFVTS